MPRNLRPVPDQTGPPTTPVPGRAALEAAWRAGQAGAILDLLAPDAVVEVLPAGWRLTAREDQRQLLTHFLPRLGLGSSRFGDDGAIELLTVWLAADQAVASDPPASGSPAAGPPSTGAGDRPSSPPPAAESGLARFFGRPVARLLAILAAVAVALPTAFAASSALLDTVYGLRPEWRPDGPPAAIGITLSAVELEERRVPDPAGNAANLISYDVELVGYRGNEVPVEWAAFDATSHQRISLDPLATGPPASIPLGTVRTEAANDRFSGNFLVPIPNRARCVFVRVYVFEDDANHTRQDYLDSAPFHTHDPANGACADDPANEPAT